MLNMVAYDEVAGQEAAFVEKWIDRVDSVMVSHYRNPPHSKRWPNIPADRKPCFLLWSQMLIAWDGRMGLCCEDFNIDHSPGRVGERPLAEIWQNGPLSELRRQHLEGRYDAHPMCRICDTWADDTGTEKDEPEKGRKITSRPSQRVYTSLSAAGKN